MEFRPCIDIHNGSVKQIVGGSLRDSNDEAAENFPAGAYRKPGILGMDVHIYLGGGYFRKLFYFRGCFYGLSEGE